MRSKLFSSLLAVLVLVSLLAAPVSAGNLPSSGNPPVAADEAKTPTAAGEKLQLADASSEVQPFNGRYFVLLEGESLVQSLSENGGRIQVDAPDSQAYLTVLRREQDARLQQISRVVQRSLQPIFRYDVVLNGFALQLSAAEAARIRGLPGVRAVIPDRLEQPLTDAGPAFIGAPEIWNGNAPGGVDSAGEGVVVGILDTGINFDHPSFADDADPAYTYPFTTPKGVCAVSGGPYENACNNKLIGAYSFTTEDVTPEDTDGHGSHTASTVAGNQLTIANFNGVPNVTISGVAPRAQIIAYDVCDEDGCATTASVAAVQQAILDGVDVINYSISGGRNPYNDPVELAFLEAFDAGIFVAASAGNLRNEAGTDGQVNHVSPWVMTVAASSHDRRFGHFVDVVGPLGLIPEDLSKGLFAMPGDGEVFSPILIETEIRSHPVNASGCDAFEENYFSELGPSIALLEASSDCLFYEQILNAKEAGASGVLVYNPLGEAFPMTGLQNLDIPTAMLNKSDGEALRTFILEMNGEPYWTMVYVTVTGIANIRVEKWGDIKADFSFRGPSANDFEVLKPDITAPGLEILAAAGDGVITPGSEAEFDLYQGTSMSSPHVAGAAALLKALHPGWSPAAIKSALMMTAQFEGLRKADRSTPADAFDHGAGRVDLGAAARVGVILDETTANFEAADPANGGDPKTLNLPALQNNFCVASCTWTRTFKNVSGVSVSMTITSPPWLTADPSSFTLADGGSQAVTFTADVSGLPLNEWSFATVNLETDNTFSDGKQIANLHLPVAVFSAAGNLPSLVQFDTYRNRASQTLEDLRALEIQDLTIVNYGLIKADLFEFNLDPDETKNDPFDDLNQVWYTTVQVPDDAVRLVAEITSTTAMDLDLFIGIDQNGNGLPDEDEIYNLSATSAALEYLSELVPPEAEWWVLVQNWDGSEGDSVVLALGVVTASDEGNLSVNGPNSNPAATPFDLEVTWDEETRPGERLYGVFTVGSQPGSEGDIGTVAVDIRRVGDEVVKLVDRDTAHVGDILTYTITITNPNPFDVDYIIEDQLPAGVSLVPGSITGGAVYDNLNRTITWSGRVSGSYLTYLMSTSRDDPNCGMPLANSGAYVDLEQYGLASIPSLSGDTKWWIWSTTGNPINYFGQDVGNVINFMDDGIAFFDPSTPGLSPWENQDIPNPAEPNNLLAFFWRDLEVQYDADNNYGITLVNLTSSGVPVAHILEMDNVHVYDEPDQDYDVEFYISKQPADTPGEYEIIFAYDNLNGPLDIGTIGLEDANASRWVKYAYDDQTLSQITNGMAICFDLSMSQSTHTITYQVRVESGAAEGWLINQVQHDNDAPQTVQEAAEARVWLAYYHYYFPVIGKGATLP